MRNDCRDISRDEALAITLELWQYLAKTGGDEADKQDWEGWERYNLPHPDCYCALCEHSTQMQTGTGPCSHCPYYQYYEAVCIFNCSSLKNWYDAETISAHRHWASECVALIEWVIAHES